MKKRFLSGLMALVMIVTSCGLSGIVQAAETTEELTNIALKNGVTMSASYSANGNGPEYLIDGVISDREGTSGYPGPRSRWHTYPQKNEQWAAATFDVAQEVHEVVWYALVDEGVVPTSTYSSIKVQVLEDGEWVDSGVEHGEIVRYTGEYSDSAASDAYIYDFDFAEPVMTEGVRMVIYAGKYAAGTEIEIMGVYQIAGGFELTPEYDSDNSVLGGTADVNKDSSERTLYVKMTDKNGAETEQTVIIPADVSSVDLELEVAESLAIGEITVTASLSDDYSAAKTYSFKKAMPQSIIDSIYEEVKTPYEYGVILRPTGVSGDYDSSLIDNPNIFRIPGDDTYVYMTYVGHDGVGYRTGIARSIDMITWEKVGVILDNGEEGQWDSYNAAGYIVRDHVWGEIPTPHINEEGKYCMTYLASDQAGYEAGIKKAGVAFADSIFNEDGTLTQWTRHEDPVISGGDGYAYEKNIIWKLQAIYNEEEDLYYGFYNAATGPEVMCGATSPDLINWTRMENNPLLDKDVAPDGGTWGSSHNADADVMKIGDYWVMHYFTATPNRGIVDSFAVSDDLVNWTKSYKTTTARNSSWSSTYAHKPCVVKHNGVVYHYYCAVGSAGRVIAVDTSIDLTVMKSAQSALSGYLMTEQRDVLQAAVDKLRTELRKNGGSLAEVEAARDELTVVMENLDSYKGTNLARTMGADVTVSIDVSGGEKENLVDGIISEREGTGSYPGPRSRWHTYPNKGEQWAAITFDGEQKVEQIVWYALVDANVVPTTAYPSVKVQVLKDGEWVDTDVQHEEIVPYTGEYADSSYTDSYVYTFNFDEAVTTEGVRMVVDSIKYAACSEFQIWGEYTIYGGFNMQVNDVEDDSVSVTIEVEERDETGKLYVQLTDEKGNISLQEIEVLANTSTFDAAIDISELAVGKIDILVSANEDLSDAKTYTVSKPIPAEVIEDIYEEVKTPYEYDVILRPTGVSGDYDKNLIDNPNVFRVPGDDEYVYMTYVGHDGVGYRTGLARSKDMVTWEKVGLILDNGEEGRWDSYNAGGYIVRDHVWGEIPTPHVNEDGLYCMTYLASDTAGYEAGLKQAGVAFTETIFNEDGTLKQWVRHEDPVISGTDGYAYEKNIIWKLQAIYNEEDGLYYGFYNAATGPEVMCGATSPDLIEWTRMENNPLLNRDTDAEGGVWGSSHNADADVVKMGDYWVMHYFTSTPSEGIVDSFAVSTDLVNWTKSYVTTTARNSTWSSTYSHKPCVIKNNGVVYHYYCAVGSQGRVIAVDTSIDLSVVKEAQAVLATELTTIQQAVLENAYDNLQYELRRSGGSLEEIEAAKTELTAVLENLDTYLEENPNAAVEIAQKAAEAAKNAQKEAEDAQAAAEAARDEAANAKVEADAAAEAAEAAQKEAEAAKAAADAAANGAVEAQAKAEAAKKAAEEAQASTALDKEAAQAAKEAAKAAQEEAEAAKAAAEAAKAEAEAAEAEAKAAQAKAEEAEKGAKEAEEGAKAAEAAAKEAEEKAEAAKEAAEDSAKAAESFNAAAAEEAKKAAEAAASAAKDANNAAEAAKDAAAESAKAAEAAASAATEAGKAAAERANAAKDAEKATKAASEAAGYAAQAAEALGKAQEAQTKAESAAKEAEDAKKAAAEAQKKAEEAQKKAEDTANSTEADKLAAEKAKAEAEAAKKAAEDAKAKAEAAKKEAVEAKAEADGYYKAAELETAKQAALLKVSLFADTVDLDAMTPEQEAAYDAAMEEAIAAISEADSKEKLENIVKALKEAVADILNPELEKERFVDVVKGDWFYDVVNEVAEIGYMTGMDETHFGPYESLSRAQFALILYRIEGEPEVETEKTFLDIAGDEWYGKAVLWAAQAGIVTGYQDGNFGPVDNITREQMAVMMYRYAKYLEKDVTKTADISAFEDADSVSEFAKEAFAWANGNGIITGKEEGTMLAPQADTARAEAAAIIQRFMK